MSAIILTGVLAVLCLVAPLSAGHLHATLSGFPDLSDLQRDAAQLFPLVVHHAQTVLFPTITFTCTGRVTNLTFMAAKPTTIFPGLSYMTTDPQIGVWRTDDDRYRRVSPEMNITVDQLTKISPSVFTFSPDNMNFSDGDYLGLYLPSQGARTIDLILQGGGGPENVYEYNADPISDILLTDSRNDRNDYPLVSVQTDPPGCAENFLTAEVLEKYAQVQLQVLETVSYEREQRLVPGINFTCDATLNKWTVAGQIGEGSSHPELQVWELANADTLRYNRVKSFQLNSSDLQPRPDQRNVYDFIPDEEVTISSGSVLGLFQPALDQSSFIVYYQSNSGPQNYGSGNRDTPRSTLQAISDNEEGNDYPLVTVSVTPADCAAGFISADSFTEQALFLANFADVYGQQRIIPVINITQDGLLTKWTFAAKNLGEAIERTEYPELQILRLNSGAYEFVHKTDSSVQPSRTGLLNVYEYLPNSPLRVGAGDILGFRQPPENSSRLSLAVIEGTGPPNEIMESSSKKRQTNTANDLPLILVDIGMLPLSPTPVMTSIEPPSSETPSPSSLHIPPAISEKSVNIETVILRTPPSSISVLPLMTSAVLGTPTNEIVSTATILHQTGLVITPELTSKTSVHVPLPDSTASPTPLAGPGEKGPGEKEDQSIPVAAIVGAGGGVLVAIGVLAVIVIIIVCVLRKRKFMHMEFTDRHTNTIEGTTKANVAYIATTSTFHDYEFVDDTEIYSKAGEIDADIIPMEEDIVYRNRAVDDETILTEENAAYAGTVWGNPQMYSQATTDELSDDSSVSEFGYIHVK